MAADGEKQLAATPSVQEAKVSRREFWQMTALSGALAGTISSAIPFLFGPVWQGYVSREYALEEQRRQAARRAIETFVSEANAFQTLVMAFQQTVSQDGQVDPEARRRIATNLLGQRHALDEIASRVPDAFKSHIAPYEEALYRFNEALNSVTGVRSMRVFWERASDLLIARQELVGSLQPLRT